MKTSKNKKQTKLSLIPKSPVIFALLLVFILTEILFMALMTVLDVLPTFIAVIVIVLLIAMTLLIMKLMGSRRERTKQRIVGVVLSVLFIILLGVGIFYMFTTYSTFSNMSDEDNQYEDYYVVVLKHGDYHKVGDIEGKTVFTYNSTDHTYVKAQKLLKKKVDVEYKPLSGYMDLKSVLIDDKGEKHDQITFLSSTNYDMICEYIEGFKKETKVIYKVSVPIGSKDIVKRVGITNESFNIYISGIDTFGGIQKVSRSDVNMIMTVNPVTKEILLTSIPRDMYVKLHSYGALDKLTHSGIYGVNETVTTVEDWLGTDINYYIRVNFTSLKDVVDAIGGVDVDSPRAFKSAVSKYRYTEGVNHLDGEAALFFARERKAFEDGDNERIKNQQRVLKAILEKITGSSVILTKYTSLMNTVGNKVQTNMTEKEISELVKMQLQDLGGWKIKSISVKGNGTMAETYSMGSRKLYVAIPDDASVKAAKEAMDKVLYAE